MAGRVTAALPGAVAAQSIARFERAKCEPTAHIAFDSPYLPPAASDLARVAWRSQHGVSPSLAVLLEEPWLGPLVDVAKSGHRALWPDAQEPVARALDGLTKAQMKELCDYLLYQPPHPRLRELKGQPTVKEEPSRYRVLDILTGALFDRDRVKLENSAYFSVKRLQELGFIAEEDGPDLFQKLASFGGGSEFFQTGEVAKRWELLKEVGIEALGYGGAFEHYHPGLILEGLWQKQPARLKAIMAEAVRLGPEPTRSLVDALREQVGSVYFPDGSRRGLNELVLEHLSAEEIVRARSALKIATDDTGGTMALIDRLGTDGFCEAAKNAVPPDDFRAKLEANKGEYTFTTVDHAPILLRKHGPTWPPKDPPRTPAIARAESEIERALKLKGAFTTERGDLALKDLSAMVRAMRERIARHPELEAQLERELDGRRFVAARVYDPLYDSGVTNPEVAYSAKGLEGWRDGERYVREMLREIGQRPLAAGEMTTILTELHKRAAKPLTDRPGPLAMLKPEDLGVLRDGSRGRSMVNLQLQHGEITTEVKVALVANPFLDPQTAELFSKEHVFSSIIYPTAGSEVAKKIEEVDLWVRENERSMPTERFVAELHYRLVSIHPFTDGQGRTTKLLLDFFMERAGLVAPLWRENRVLVAREEWHHAVAEGVRFHFATVDRYFRTAIEREPAA